MSVKAPNRARQEVDPQTRKAMCVCGSGPQRQVCSSWARCESTGDWGGTLSRKSQRGDRFLSGEGKRQPQKHLILFQFLSLSFLIFEMELLRPIS